MDSISQLALGAAVTVAVMGRRTAVWKATAWGALAGTLPDLDALVDHGEPIANMVLHRGHSHGLFWLTLFSLPMAWLVARISGDGPIWRRWWLAIWLTLVTHPLLDTLTIYGTQLAMPFSNYPFGVGSIFIVDPLYTLPLLIGTVWALLVRRKVGAGLRRANAIGLALSTVYLAWSMAAQQHVSSIARAALQTQGIVAHSVLVTPTPLNTVLWRVVALSGEDAYYEGFYSLLDAKPPRIAFVAYPRGKALEAEVGNLSGVQRLRAFTKGFYTLRQEAGQVLISDLRMGQEPDYAFTFGVASKQDSAAAVPLALPVQVGGRGGSSSIECSLSWLGQRIMGVPLPPTAQYCQQATQKQ